MSSKAKFSKGDVSEDALPILSSLLGSDNPTNAGGGGWDEQEEAMVIPEKTEMGEKMINETRGTVITGLPSLWQKMAQTTGWRQKKGTTRNCRKVNGSLGG